MIGADADTTADLAAMAERAAASAAIFQLACEHFAIARACGWETPQGIAHRAAHARLAAFHDAVARAPQIGHA